MGDRIVASAMIAPCVGNRGLSFVPTLAYNPFNTRVDIYKLLRNIKLKKFFGDTPAPMQRFKKQSTFVPNVTDASIAVFEELVMWDLRTMEANKRNVKSNLKRIEFEAIQDLANDTSLVIKPADKGGGVVILDRTVYEEEAYCQLGDTVAYHKLQKDPTREIQRIIRIMLNDALA